MHLQAAKRAVVRSGLFGADSIAAKLLGQERDGAVFDFANDYVLIRDSARALNYKGTIQNAIDASVITFTRATNASRVNASGLIETVSSGIWRREYSPTTLAPLGYLPEPSRQNLCTYSNDFSNPAWTRSNMDAAMTATGPDGVANSASTLTATAGNATALQAITSASAARITSTYIKRRTGTGTINITHDNGTTWTAVTVTSGWTRVSNPSTTAANPTVGIRIVTSGDAVDVAYFQHELGAYATSPIPTPSSSTVTRNADVMTVATSKLPFSASAWTMLGIMQRSQDAGTNGEVMSEIDDGSVNNRTAITNGSAGSLQSRGLVVVSSSAVMGSASGNNAAAARHKAALAVAANDFQLVVNGVSISTVTTSAVPAGMTTLRFGNSASGAGPSIAIHEAFVFIPRRLTAAEMIARTA